MPLAQAKSVSLAQSIGHGEKELLAVYPAASFLPCLVFSLSLYLWRFRALSDSLPLWNHFLWFQEPQFAN